MNKSVGQPSAEDLAQGRSYYSLLFSHEFARAFWKQGSQISFVVPGASYTRRDKEGRIVTVTRKPFTRRTLKANVWNIICEKWRRTTSPSDTFDVFWSMRETQNR